MVATKGFKYPDRELYDWVLNELEKRNINRRTIGEIAYKMQHQYLPNLTVDDFGKELDEVLKKREVLNILATGFALDNLADEGLLPSPLQEIIENDLGVYGVDESLSLCLSQLYGSIAVTNYGFTDKDKPGIAKDLDNSHGHVNTFADDLALALASAVIGRCGHGSKLDLDESKPEEENTTIPTEDKFINMVALEVNHSRLGDELEEAFNHDYYIAISMAKRDVLRLDFSDNKFKLEYSREISLPSLYKFILNEHEESLPWFASDNWLAVYIAYYMRHNNMYIDPDEVAEAINRMNALDSRLKKIVKGYGDGSISLNGLFETHFASNSSNRKED